MLGEYGLLVISQQGIKSDSPGRGIEFDEDAVRCNAVKRSCQTDRVSLGDKVQVKNSKAIYVMALDRIGLLPGVE